MEKKLGSWDKNCEEIDTYLGGKKYTERWQFIRYVRSNKENNRNKIQTTLTDKWIQHYKNLVSEKIKEYETRKDEITPEEKKAQINTYIIRKAVI